MSVRTPDIVRAELVEAKDTSGLSWRAFAALPENLPVPPGTLNAIYNGYPIPKRWYPHFGLRAFKPTPVCWCGEVHMKGHPKPRTPKPCPRFDKLEVLRWQLEQRA